MLIYSDPLHVKAFKAMLTNIDKYAYERCLKSLNYHPLSKEVNYRAVYWFLRNKKFLLARKSLHVLKSQFPSAAETIYAEVQIA